MNELDLIAAKRRMLVKRAEAQRAELTVACQVLQRPAALFDRGAAVAASIKAHPRLVVGATALLGVVLVKRGLIGALAGAVLRSARYAIPLARFWISRK